MTTPHQAFAGQQDLGTGSIKDPRGREPPVEKPGAQDVEAVENHPAVDSRQVAL